MAATGEGPERAMSQYAHGADRSSVGGKLASTELCTWRASVVFTYLCDTVQDNWRRGGEEARSSRAGVVWDVLSPGSPCRLVAGWERGGSKAPGPLD